MEAQSSQVVRGMLHHVNEFEVRRWTWHGEDGDFEWRQRTQRRFAGEPTRLDVLKLHHRQTHTLSPLHSMYSCVVEPGREENEERNHICVVTLPHSTQTSEDPSTTCGCMSSRRQMRMLLF